MNNFQIGDIVTLIHAANPKNFRGIIMNTYINYRGIQYYIVYWTNRDMFDCRYAESELMEYPNETPNW